MPACSGPSAQTCRASKANPASCLQWALLSEMFERLHPKACEARARARGRGTAAEPRGFRVEWGGGPWAKPYTLNGPKPPKDP